MVPEAVNVLAVVRMSFRQSWNDLALGKLDVVLLDVAALRRFEQFVTLVHFHAQAVQRGHHFAGVRDDWVFAVWQLGQVVTNDLVVQRELHLLGVHQDQLQRRWMSAVQHAHEHGVQPNRLSLSRGPGHEQVRHFGHVEDVGLVADGLAQSDGQLGVAVLELLAGDERAHADDVRVGVGHFNPDGAFAGNGRDDANAQGCQTQGDVVLQIFDLADPNPGRRHDFVQRHRRSDFCRNLVDFNLEVLQRADDVVLVDVKFFRRDAVFAVAVVCQFVDVGKLELGQIQRRIKRSKFLGQVFQLCCCQNLLVLSFLHFEFHVVFCLLRCRGRCILWLRCWLQLRFGRHIDLEGHGFQVV